MSLQTDGPYLGALLLLVGVLTGATGGCYTNFGKGGVDCSLWRVTVPELIYYAVPWTLILAGAGLIVASLIGKRKTAQGRAPY